MRFVLSLFATISLIIFSSSCKHEVPLPAPGTDTTTGNYPDAIARILIDKCATAGCHNQASYKNAGGLLLDSWDHLFQGGSNGAVAIPYSPQYSSLLFFVNTDSALGPVARPTMPKDGVPLSRDEYITLRDWIMNGAPDRNGTIPFASDAATRQKAYLTMQACDEIAVIDSKSGLIMRYIGVGNIPGQAEIAHCVRFSLDGQYAFVSFTAGNVVQKIDAATDKVVATVSLDQVLDTVSAQWNVVQPNADGSRFVVTDMRDGSRSNGTGGTGGRLLYYDFNTGYKFAKDGLPAAHGIVANPGFDTFYVTQQYGNNIYKVYMSPENPAPSYDIINIKAGIPSPDPHEIIETPDRKKLFITCQTTNEVRVVSTETDQLYSSGGLPSAIPVGIKPQEMSMSYKQPYLFVTCIEDTNPFATPQVTFRGSVYVINYNTHQVVKVIQARFASPHGVAVDDKNGLVYIGSTNYSPNGPAPHHVSSCAGDNGYYNVYDLNTLEPAMTTRFEALPYPYSCDVRFKQ